MIQHDIAWTTGPMAGAHQVTQTLAADVKARRADLAAILRAGDRACRGAQLVSVHGQAVVVVGAKEWQEMRRAMVAAGNALVGERGPVN